MDELTRRVYENQQAQRDFVMKSVSSDLEKAGKSYFSPKEREKLAKKKEAMPGGSFPIRNEQDLKDAIKSVGRAESYTAAKAWIIKRAKEMGKESLLPEEWNVTKALENDIYKAKSGIYADTPYNRKHGLVGMKYGKEKKEENKLSPEESRKNQLKKLISETSDEKAKFHLQQALAKEGDALQSEPHIRAYKKRIEELKQNK